jgi:hypothetical protein
VSLTREADVLACIRRTNADVDALVSALIPSLPHEFGALYELRGRATASCRRALLTSAGKPHDEAWRDWCLTVAALLDRAPEIEDAAGALALSRLRALVEENADLLR